MTALEFREAGVPFETDERGSLRWPPRATRELAPVLREEVLRRLPMMAALGPLPDDAPRTGACERCRDPMAHGRGGWCELCGLARAAHLRGVRA